MRDVNSSIVYCNIPPLCHLKSYPRLCTNMMNLQMHTMLTKATRMYEAWSSTAAIVKVTTVCGGDESSNSRTSARQGTRPRGRPGLKDRRSV
jgi:hypothetical protein